MMSFVSTSHFGASERFPISRTFGMAGTAAPVEQLAPLVPAAANPWLCRYDDFNLTICGAL
jgi:hypothetical protein